MKTPTRKSASDFCKMLVLLAIAGVALGQSMEDAAEKEFATSARAACIQSYTCFEISNDYPQTLPALETLPFSTIDFKKDPAEYMAAVLAYVVEGNPEVDWDVSRNKTRKWYHAPWMHLSREPVHGLTGERGSRWHELSGTQSRRTSNWAVGFYNAPGGYAIGKAWRNRARPNSNGTIFPVGTVTAKLLFTDATEAEAPFLYGSDNLVWDADIKNDGKPTTLRLLQMDVAIKTASSDSHGWVFGTFVFDAAQSKPHYWENLVSIGLEWGSSPSFEYPAFAAGGSPGESRVEANASAMFQGRAPDMRMGYLGRMNGPVDSPLSSCLSCHSRALDSVGKDAPAFNPPDTALCIQRVPVAGNETYRRMSNCAVDEKLISLYTRNLKSNEPFIAGFNSLDYSLQLAMGIAQWHAWYKRSFSAEYAKEFPDPTSEVTLRNLSKEAQLLRLETQSIPMVPAVDAFHRGD